MNDSLPGIDVPPHNLDLDGCVTWGIDPSSKRVALAVVSPYFEERIRWRTASLSQAPNNLVRFGEAFAAQVDLFTEFITTVPNVVYIEQPFVPRDHRGAPMHLFAYGVTLAALGQVLGPVPVVEIGANVWKSKAMGTGHGFAKKPEIMRWAHSIGYTGDLEDEADAIGVATAGAVLEAAKRPIPA